MWIVLVCLVVSVGFSESSVVMEGSLYCGKTIISCSSLMYYFICGQEAECTTADRGFFR